MRAIILAGGKGTRLKPYTTLIPKPLVPIGGEYSVLELVIFQLAGAGFTHITLAVNHLADLIRAYFGDGGKWGVLIDYSLEDKPLNTIGPLTLIPDLPENFLVMNADVLCDLDIRKFYAEHVKRESYVSVAACSRKYEIDFGVLKYSADNYLTEFHEKPVYNFDVSMGIYCLSRSAVKELPKGRAYGFNHLMIDGIKNKRKIWINPFDGVWLDIGRVEDYQYADEHYAEVKKMMGLEK